jgi:hypothetical protein
MEADAQNPRDPSNGASLSDNRLGPSARLRISKMV